MEAAGSSCAAAALVGGPPGLLEFALSAFAVQAGGSSRLVGLSASAVLMGILLFARPLMRWIPVPVMGGLLAYVGLHLVLDWLLQHRTAAHSAVGASRWIIWSTCAACVLLGLVPGAIVGFALHWVSSCLGHEVTGELESSRTGMEWRNSIRSVITSFKTNSAVESKEHAEDDTVL